MLLGHFLASFVFLAEAFASAGQGTTPQHHAGTFADPPSNERCRLRYWLPDASVDPSVVKADIKSAGSVGAGGMEFLPYFEYGGLGPLGHMPPGANWDKYNFGTPAFQALFRAALEAHEENGLLMDFALGPNQGQGVPATSTDDGLQWDLVPFTALVPKDGRFDATIPGWGTGELVAFVSALVTSEVPKTFPTQSEFEVVNVTYVQYRLQEDTLNDQTGHVSNDGRASLSFPAAVNGSGYRVFAFFQTRSLNKNLGFNVTEEMTDDSIFRNGSYNVDHFSARGAETVARFWEEHILTNGVKDLLVKVGNYAWEDSIEVTSHISWSREMPQRYQNKFGHSIKPYLPLLTFKQNNIALQPAEPGKFQCVLEEDETTQRYLNNFHEVLAEGYIDYLDALRDWARGHLGKDTSAQPSYNMPMDMLRSIPHVGAPECESFGFKDDVDSYRRFVGPAQLTGKRVISNELGAVPSSGYQYTLPKMLFSVNRAFATGVNQFVIHGGQYTGNYYATTWPGHTAFTYLFSELWSEKQPSWNHGFQDCMDYTARISHILQQAVPKIDVARYSKESVTQIQPGKEPADLVEGGWSYTYISPDNFILDEAYVESGVLAPPGPAWRAMLVESSENLTLNAVKTLQNYTSAGLPVIFSGGSPGFFPFANDTKEEFDRELSVLKRSPNVHQSASTGVAEQLSSLGLAPRVAVKTNGTWYTSWTEVDGIGYALIYSDINGSTGEVTVSTAQTPYLYDAWTGRRSPLFVYDQRDGKTTIPLDLAGNQTVLIAFSDNLSRELPTLKRHFVSLPSNVVGTAANCHGGGSLHVAYSESLQNASLSDGSQISIDGTSVPRPFQLGNWTLVAEHWEAPANLSDASVLAVKHNTTHELIELASWDKTPALTNVSGVGYYRTTLQWPPSGQPQGDSASGAYINIGRVVHTARLLVNGQQTPSWDYLKPVTDISSYLKDGENEIVVITSTPMWNYLRGMLPDLRTAGGIPFPLLTHQPLTPVEVGLVAPVTVTPFKNFTF